MYTIRFSHTSGTPKVARRPLRRFDSLESAGAALGGFWHATALSADDSARIGRRRRKHVKSLVLAMKTGWSGQLGPDRVARRISDSGH